VTAAADEPGPRSEDQGVAVNHEEELLSEAYTAYNTQDVDGLLALVSDDVDWPDGSSRLRGKAAVRAYRTDQWTRTHTHDQPVDGRPATGWPGRGPDQPDRPVLDGYVISTGWFCHVHRNRGPSRRPHGCRG